METFATTNDKEKIVEIKLCEQMFTRTEALCCSSIFLAASLPFFRSISSSSFSL